MEPCRTLVATAALALAAAAGADAQTDATRNVRTYGTTVTGFAGAASANSEAGGLFGGAAGWEVTPWIGVEGSASWLDRPGAGEAFAAALTAHLNLTTPRRLVPFVKGGVGLYRASVEAGRLDLPDFYRRRLDAGGSGLRAVQTFTDPSLVFGGGANVFATRHFAIRPEIEAIVARRQSQSFIVTAASVRFIYHFEEHPVDLTGPR